jgi:hypothetical protein
MLVSCKVRLCLIGDEKRTGSVVYPMAGKSTNALSPLVWFVPIRNNPQQASRRIERDMQVGAFGCLGQPCYTFRLL